MSIEEFRTALQECIAWLKENPAPNTRRPNQSVRGMAEYDPDEYQTMLDLLHARQRRYLIVVVGVLDAACVLWFLGEIGFDALSLRAVLVMGLVAIGLATLFVALIDRWVERAGIHTAVSRLGLVLGIVFLHVAAALLAVWVLAGSSGMTALPRASSRSLFSRCWACDGRFFRSWPTASCCMWRPDGSTGTHGRGHRWVDALRSLPLTSFFVSSTRLALSLGHLFSRTSRQWPTSRTTR